MYTRPSAPRPIGGVLDDAISVYRNSYARVWPLTLGAAVVAVLPGIFLGLRLAHAQAGGVASVMVLMKSPSYWFTYLLLMVFNLAVYGALVSALETFIERGTVSLSDALAAGVAALPRVAAVSLLLGLMIGVGFLLLVVPGVYLSGIYLLAVIVVIVEGAGIFESFGISRALIKGHWWRSVTIVTVGFVIMIVFSLIAGLVNGILVATFGLGSSVAVASQSLVGLVVNVFLMPLLPCFLLSMYHDLKLRHDGGDLAARVDALAAR